jgi:hypothetical protein
MKIIINTNMNFCFYLVITIIFLIRSLLIRWGHAVAYLVEALCYKLEGHRFESRMRWIFFNLLNTSSRTMALESTQPLTKMSTRSLPRCKKLPARSADNLAAVY